MDKRLAKLLKRNRRKQSKEQRAARQAYDPNMFVFRKPKPKESE